MSEQEVKQQKEKPVEEVQEKQVKGDDKRKGRKNNDRTDRRQNQRDRRRKPQVKFEIEVTLETVIPDMPSKGSVLSRPDDKLHKDKLKAIDNRLNEKKNERKVYSEELRKQRKVLNQVDDMDLLRDLKRAKFDEKNKVVTKFREVNAVKNQYNTQIAGLTKQADKYRKHMGALFRLSEIESRIDALEDSLQNDQLTIANEKEKEKQLKQLKKSRPFAEPLEGLQVQMKELLTKKKEQGRESQKLYQELQVINTAIKTIQEDLEIQKNVQKAKRDEMEPQAKTKKDEFNEQIQAILSEKQAQYAANEQNWKEFKDQSLLIKKIKYMKRIMEDLKKKKRQEDWQERQATQREAAIAELRENPWVKEISELEDLLSYCNLLNPQQQKQETVVQTEEQNTQQVQPSQFKNDEVQMVVNKRDLQEDNGWLGRKNKGGRKRRGRKKKQQKVVVQQNNLLHSVEILESFAKMSVGAPNYKNQVADSIKFIEEKIEEFKNKAPPSDDVLANQLDGVDEAINSDDEDDQVQQKQQKKQKRRSNKAFNMDQEDLFPALGS